MTNGTDKTTKDALAVGQTWTPRNGKPRRIIHIPDLPGVHYVTCPDERVGHAEGSFAFRAWIRRTKAQLNGATKDE